MPYIQKCYSVKNSIEKILQDADLDSNSGESVSSPFFSANRDRTKYEYAEISFFDKALQIPIGILDQMKEQSSDDKPSKSVRRSHQKSRTGCGNCKRRRIKVSPMSDCTRTLLAKQRFLYFDPRLQGLYNIESH